MGFTAFIDVAIGLVVVYLGASLMVTVFNEWLSQWKKWRKEVLAASLKRLFSSDGFAQAQDKLPNLPRLADLLVPQGSQADPNLLARGIAAVFANGANGGQVSLQAVRDGLAQFPASQAKEALTALAATCADDLDRFLREAATWIDQALVDMGHVYRSKMQLISFILGLLIAGTLNIDTLHLVDRLYTDKALRDQAVATAEGLVGGAMGEKLDGCAREWASDPKAVSQGCVPVARLLDATAARQQPGQLALPIGWGEGGLAQSSKFPCWLVIVLRIAGWVLTAIAISFGAPFWFDLLSKLLSLRRGIGAAK